MEKIDARGLACPQPVILAKKALEKNGTVEMTVDNKTAVENVTRLAKRENCSVNITGMDDGTYLMKLEKSLVEKDTVPCDSIREYSCPEPMHGLVVVLSADSMGRGSEELGRVLIRSFLHTLNETSPLPDKIICYNSGVRLVVPGSEVIDDLQSLETKGVEILVCGTCLNYFGLADKLRAGKVSNMFDIVSIITNASRLICP